MHARVGTHVHGNNFADRRKGGRNSDKQSTMGITATPPREPDSIAHALAWHWTYHSHKNKREWVSRSFSTKVPLPGLPQFDLGRPSGATPGDRVLKSCRGFTRTTRSITSADGTRVACHSTLDVYNPVPPPAPTRETLPLTPRLNAHSGSVHESAAAAWATTRESAVSRTPKHGCTMKMRAAAGCRGEGHHHELERPTCVSGSPSQLRQKHPTPVAVSRRCVHAPCGLKVPGKNKPTRFLLTHFFQTTNNIVST